MNTQFEDASPPVPDARATSQRTSWWRFSQLLLLGVSLLLTGQAFSAPTELGDFINPPTNAINYTLEGCRNGNTGGVVILPGDDPDHPNDYVCDDSRYTTGNIKNWNELDLVPFRLTVKNKTNQPQTYDVLVGADNNHIGSIGFDRLTEPEVIRVTGCDILYDDTYLDDVTGGVELAILRQIRLVNQPAGSTCIIDWQARLAIGSSAYTGSSLQAYMFETDTQEGKRTVPINDDPDPIGFVKSMNALQDSEYDWTVSKTANPVDVNFGNTCKLDPSVDSKDVKININWQRIGPTPSGDLSVTTVIDVYNPASRTIGYDISDELFNGTTPLGLTQECDGDGDSSPGGTLLVPARSSESCTLSWTVPYTAGIALNDKATGSVIDPVFSDCLCTVTATASTGIESSGNVINATATIKDTESLSGSNFQFVVEGITNGSLEGLTVPTGYISAGTDVVWNSGSLSSSGSVTLDKEIYFLTPKTSTGTLSDTVVLTGSNGLSRQDNASVTIKTDPLVELTIEKTIPYPLYTGDPSVSFCFDISGPGVSITGTDAPCIDFYPGDPKTQSTKVSDLPPGTYTVTEQTVTGWQPANNPLQVSMSAETFAACTGKVSFSNDIPTYPSAKAVKVTDPATLGTSPLNAGWTFNLNEAGNASNPVDTCVTDATGACDFTYTIKPDIQYTITETAQTGWDEDTSAATGCTFTANWPQDFLDATQYTCSRKNVQRGKVIVEKATVPADNSTDFSFGEDITQTGSFTLDGNAGDDATSNMKTFSDVVRGSYVVTETDSSPGYDDTDVTSPYEWDLISVACTDDYDGNGYNVNSSSVDKALLKANVELDAGETVYCKFTNQQRGMVTVNKTVNGVPTAGYVFDVRSGSTVVASDTSEADGSVDFGGLYFLPGDYALCEQEVDAGWTSSLELDPNVFYPINGDNSYVCVPFPVDSGYTVGLGAGETQSFQVENTPPPGGNARTIGYWRNWSGECTNGNQEDKLGEALQSGARLGLLSWPTPNITCEAVNILSKRNLNGDNRANDPAYALASQFLAYQLNVNAGANSCGLAPYANQAHALFDGIEFNGYDPAGAGSKKKDKTYVRRNSSDIVSWSFLATLFDDYNNNELSCPYPAP